MDQTQLQLLETSLHEWETRVKEILHDVDHWIIIRESVIKSLQEMCDDRMKFVDSACKIISNLGYEGNEQKTKKRVKHTS
jgi:hypothetical protein